MAYSIALCDDNPADAAYLLELTRGWAADRGQPVKVRCFSSAESLLFQREDEGFDILLLDIEMGGMDGVTLARELRRQSETVQIIFVTGYSDYIAEGYEVAALHYLMKPVGADKLFAVLDRAVDRLQRDERCLNLELPGETVRIPFYEIRYLDVRQNYVTIHGRRDYVVKRSLHDLEQQLDSRFFRAGRAMILNLFCVRRVTRAEVYLSDGTVLPLPRGAYEPLNRAIIQYT